MQSVSVLFNFVMSVTFIASVQAAKMSKDAKPPAAVGGEGGTHKPTKPSESGNPQKPDGAAKPTDPQKPDGAAKPTDQQKPDGTAKPTDQQKPEDKKKDGEKDPLTVLSTMPNETVYTVEVLQSMVSSLYGSGLYIVDSETGAPVKYGDDFSNATLRVPVLEVLLKSLLRVVVADPKYVQTLKTQIETTFEKVEEAQSEGKDKKEGATKPGEDKDEEDNAKKLGEDKDKKDGAKKLGEEKEGKEENKDGAKKPGEDKEGATGSDASAPLDAGSEAGKPPVAEATT